MTKTIKEMQFSLTDARKALDLAFQKTGEHTPVSEALIIAMAAIIDRFDKLERKIEALHDVSSAALKAAADDHAAMRETVSNKRR